MAHKAWEAIWEAAKALDSDLHGMSWNGFALAGDENSVKELGRLVNLGERLAWFEETYKREHSKAAQVVTVHMPLPRSDLKQLIGKELERQFDGDANPGQWNNGVFQKLNGDLMVELDGMLNITQLAKVLQ